jgi:hypothetical protein
MRWVGRVAHTGGEERCVQDFGGENLMDKNHLKDLGIDRRIILK